ncbi:MAG: hypothetical protein ACREPN_08145 [Rudaea sp.]
MNEDEIGYALSKQVRDMHRGQVVLTTHYGSLTLYDRDAIKIANLCERILRKKLVQLQRKRTQQP